MTPPVSHSTSPAKGPAKPLSRRGVPRWAVYFASALGVVYILNPTFGVFELLPDNLPFVGNLDEGAAALLVWYGFLEIWEQVRSRRDGKSSAAAAN